jgi:hypothetical protein
MPGDGLGDMALTPVDISKATGDRAPRPLAIAIRPAVQNPDRNWLVRFDPARYRLSDARREDQRQEEQRASDRKSAQRDGEDAPHGCR